MPDEYACDWLLRFDILDVVPSYNMEHEEVDSVDYIEGDIHGDFLVLECY